MSAVSSPKYVRRAVVSPGHGVRLERVEEPRPGPGEALVRTLLVGLCGSDTHALDGHSAFLDRPYVAGHEAVGTVAEVGAGVDEALVGRRVLLKPNVVCGSCENCRAGRTNACEVLTWVGCDTSGARPGAMADAFIAPAGNLYDVPAGVTDAEAVLIECLATPTHAVRILGGLRDARVCVLGAGTIGLLALVAARRAGAARVVVTDVVSEKLERALRVGADAAVDALAPDAVTQIRDLLGGGADAVLDCVANARSFAQAVTAVRRAGTVAVVGVPAGEVTVPLHLVQDWEIRVQGCAAYAEVDVLAAMDAVAAGALPLDELVAGTFGLEEVGSAFDTASRPEMGKVFVEPRRDAPTREAP